MKLLLMGPQGAGKGTIANQLKDHFHIPHISMGDLLRETLETPSELATEIRSYMQQGLLVPIATIKKMLKDRLSQKDTELGFILDGFPRDEEQRKVLQEISKVDFVVVLDVPQELSIKRLSSRIQCPVCGAIYNLESRPPKKEGICDICQNTLQRREDDKPEAIQKRLLIYEKETRPLLEFYKDQLILVDAASKTPEEIVEEILQRMKA